MAFQNKNLSVIAYANGFTLWHYVSQDNLSAICSQDYFKRVAASLINSGDLFIINAVDGTCFRYVEACKFDEFVKLQKLK